MRKTIGFAAGLLAGVSIALAPAMAQQNVKPPPGQSQNNNVAPVADDLGAEFLAAAIESCGSATMGLDVVSPELADAGFTIDEEPENGPFQDELSASIGFEEWTGYFYATIEHYPESELGYCSFEVDVPPPIDLNLLSTEFRLNGSVETVGDATYASFEEFEGGVQFYVLAYVTPDLFHLQVTWLIASPEG